MQPVQRKEGAEMMKGVICPYCGDEMKLRTECRICRLPHYHPEYWPCKIDWQYTAYFVCEECSRRTSNLLHSPQEHAETEEEAVAKAYKSAIMRTAQSNEAKSPWISIEDRQPNKEVLAANFAPGTHGYKECIIGYISELRSTSPNGWTAENEHEILYNVTHWMPIPGGPD